MASGERTLEEHLVEAGNRLLQPPSSVDELLRLLDQIESFLSTVEQSPSKSMQEALSPSTKALVADELLRHQDVDVKVAVASCVSEITRITAPDAPYDDDQMKDVFQLIVSSFENLSDKSSRSYHKRILILETVAKIRSCVVMLDLECDGLIVEMFQHFMKAIRDYHPENVFSSMETIMTLVLEESEDISLELVSPILAGVKRDNQEVLPIARKLGKRVLENCAIKLKPYLTQAKKTLGFSLDDYSKVVTSICDGTAVAVGRNDDNPCGDQMAEESKLSRASPEGPPQADETKLPETSSDDAAQDQVTKESVSEIHPGDHSVTTNGVAETANEDRLADLESSKEPEHAQPADQSVDTTVTSNAEPNDSDSGNILKSESKSEKTSKKRGSKPTSLIKSTEPSEEPSDEVAVPSENEKETVQPSSPKALESEPMNVASPSPSGGVPDDGHPKNDGRSKKKKNSIQEARPSDDVSKKASEGTSDTEVKPQKRSGKRARGGSTPQDKTLALVDTSKSEDGATSDSDAKPLKQSARKGDVKDNTGDGSSSKKEDGKRRRSGKATSEKDLTKFSIKDDAKGKVSSAKPASKLAKEAGHLEETPKTHSKRKRTPVKDKATDTTEYGANLVGSKVKVWWPDDKEFYEGVIDSFDTDELKHKVLYTDGDEELLDLREEKWEFVGGDAKPDGEQATECRSPDASHEMHKKKKAKSNSEPAAKQGKMEGSRGGGTSSSKLKGAATKSGRDTPKSGGKSEDDNVGKSKDRSKKSSGKSGDTSRTDGKSKNTDGGTPKTTTKSKQDTPKTATKETPKTTANSKGKAPKSGDNSNTNGGSGKVKSASGKVKTPEGDTKSGKKRRRGARY